MRIASPARDAKPIDAVLMFMRLLGLGLGGARCQDGMALSRRAGCQAGKVEDLFGLFDGHLARQGYIARGGQILDASIVPVPLPSQHP